MAGQSLTVGDQVIGDQLINTGQNGLFVSRVDSQSMTLAEAFEYAGKHNVRVPTVAEAAQIITTIQGIEGDCPLKTAFRNTTSILCANDGGQRPVAMFFDGDEPAFQAEDTVGQYRFVQGLKERDQPFEHLKLYL